MEYTVERLRGTEDGEREEERATTGKYWNRLSLLMKN